MGDSMKDWGRFLPGLIFSESTRSIMRPLAYQSRGHEGREGEGACGPSITPCTVEGLNWHRFDRRRRLSDINLSRERITRGRGVKLCIEIMMSLDTISGRVVESSRDLCMFSSFYMSTNMYLVDVYRLTLQNRK